MKGDGVEEEEVAGSGGVEGVEGGEDAGRVVAECFARELGVGEEGDVAEVVCADEERVDGGMGR